MRTLANIEMHSVAKVEYNIRNIGFSTTKGTRKLVRLLVTDENGAEFKLVMYTDDTKFKLTKNKEL